MKLTAHQRALNRQRQQTFLKKARTGGWRPRSMMLHDRWYQTAKQWAARLQTTQEAIFRAAFESGLRHLTSGDVIRTDRFYHETMNLPMHLLVKYKHWQIRHDPKTGRAMGFEPIQRSA